MTRLGLIRDHDEDVAEDLRLRHVGGLLGANAAALPKHVDYSSLLDRVPDQGNTSSCVGWAFSTSLLLRSRIAGAPIARPSAKAIYDIARLLDAPRHRLADVGSRPRAAIMGMVEYGLVDEERWPLTDENVDEAPPLDVFRAALGATLAAYYRIGGADIATLVRTALARGLVPAFGMQVDAEYQRYDGSGVYGSRTGAIVGAHMQAIVGYAPGAFLVANSWGPSWGAAGFARVSADVLNSLDVFDVLVPTIVPSAIV